MHLHAGGGGVHAARGRRLEAGEDLLSAGAQEAEAGEDVVEAGEDPLKEAGGGGGPARCRSAGGCRGPC